MSFGVSETPGSPCCGRRSVKGTRRSGRTTPRETWGDYIVQLHEKDKGNTQMGINEAERGTECV